jgi:N-acetylmuramoyl-L-alanine amidase
VFGGDGVLRRGRVRGAALAVVAGLTAAACSGCASSAVTAGRAAPAASAGRAARAASAGRAAPAAASAAPSTRAATPTTRAATPTTPTAPVPTTTPNAPRPRSKPKPRPRPQPSAALPLAGRRVGIDPGHNGNSYTDPSYLSAQIWNGRASENCDTTGTQTPSGYTEARFNWNVATFLERDLVAEGAEVVLTRHSNTGVGPCVTTRAQIINRFRADVAVDIHADGGPPDGRGFAILLPVADGPNDRVIASSRRFAVDLRARFLAVTNMPVSTYDGIDAFQPRDDLAGLNLTTVPKVLIECGNMQNAADDALLTRTAWQRDAARAMAQAITGFLSKT